MEMQDEAINDCTALVTQPQPRLVAHVSVELTFEPCA
jgi:hypothetical protein